MTNKNNFYKRYNQLINKISVSKDEFNQYANFNYYNLNSIFNSIKPLLLEYDLFLNFNEEFKTIDNKIYLVCEAVLLDIEEPNNKITTKSHVFIDFNKKKFQLEQISGSVSSYGRKYALNSLLLITDSKDLDSINTHDNTPISHNYTQPKKTNAEHLKQINFYNDLINDENITKKDFLSISKDAREYINKNNINKTDSQVIKLISNVNSKKQLLIS